MFKEERETFQDPLGPVQELSEQLLVFKIVMIFGNFQCNRHLSKTGLDLRGSRNRLYRKHRKNWTKEPSPGSHCLGSWRKLTEKQLPHGLRDREAATLLKDTLSLPLCLGDNAGHGLSRR